jgi:hypothetical protein
VSPADGSKEDLPEIDVDFNDSWGNDMFGIEVPSAKESFEKHGLTPREGLRIKVRQEDLAAEAILVPHEHVPGHPFLVAKLTEPLHEVPWL